MGNVICEVCFIPQLSAFLCNSTDVSLNRELYLFLSIEPVRYMNNQEIIQIAVVVDNLEESLPKYGKMVYTARAWDIYDFTTSRWKTPHTVAN